MNLRKLYHRSLAVIIVILLICIVQVKGTMDARASMCAERGGVMNGNKCIPNVPKLEAKK